MNLIQISHPKHIKEFLYLPIKLYRNDPNFIRPLDDDIEQVFDKNRNEYFKTGDCTRWILQDEKGETIGRIAAFYNNDPSVTNEQPTGGTGFFECINSREAAFLLFDTAKAWLKEHGMEAMDGPVNFGPRDRWWGLLADGFYEPCYCSNYNPLYYRELFEAYGFQLYFKQYTYYRKVHEKLRPAHYAIAERIAANPDYSFSHLHKNNLERYVQDFLTVYNKAWVNHKGVEDMTLAKAKEIVYSLKPVLDEKIMWFAYYKKEPIGFFICIPELNQLIVKYADGKLDLWGKLRLLYNKWTGKCKSMYGIVFGVIPEHQRKGIEAAMIVASSKVIQDKDQVPYRELQMNWIGDFNPKMMHVASQIGAEIYKTHHTYRYLFDRVKEFKRHPEI